MIYIFIHGIGQDPSGIVSNPSSWNEVISYLPKCKNTLCPDLFSFFDNKEANYENLYTSFVEYCSNISESFNICELSLGGIVALNYAIDYPQKVNSLVLIGTPYKITKIMFSIQTAILKLLPKSVFAKMGGDKKDIVKLVKSMKNIDFSKGLKNIICPTLIICGQKDKVNMKSSKYLSENIKNANISIIKNTGHVVNTENSKSLPIELENFYK